MIVIRYTMDIRGVFAHYDDTGPSAMVLCILIDSSTLVTLGLNGATASVIIITLDRYWKIVHPIHHRKHYRKWMLYVGLFVPWLYGVSVHLLPSIGTTKIVDGTCHPESFWPSPSMERVCLSRLSSSIMPSPFAFKIIVTFCTIDLVQNITYLPQENACNDIGIGCNT